MSKRILRTSWLFYTMLCAVPLISSREELNRELRYAILHGQPEKAQQLVDRGAEPTQELLRGVVNYRDPSVADRMVQILIEGGLDPTASDIPGLLLLSAAVAHNWDVVKRLIRMGINPNIESAAQGLTPVMWAAVDGNEEAVQMLFRFGAKKPTPEQRAKLIADADALDLIDRNAHLATERAAMIKEGLEEQYGTPRAITRMIGEFGAESLPDRPHYGAWKEQ